MTPIYQPTYKCMPTILLVMAMEEEAVPVLDLLPFEPWPHVLDAPLPPHAYTLHLGDLRISLVINGRDSVYHVASFGTDAATLATYLGIKTFNPELVMSVGVAGGFQSKGAEIGSVYVSTDSIRYFDRRVSIKSPNYHDYAIGYYPVMDASHMVRSLGLQTGIVVTGGSFENSSTDIEQIQYHNAVAIEMEAAAVAKVSMLMEIPFLAVKSVVNFEEDPVFADQFEKNFQTATVSLAHRLKDIIDYFARYGILEKT